MRSPHNPRVQLPRQSRRQRAGRLARFAVLGISSAAMLAAAFSGWPAPARSQTTSPSPTTSSTEPEENVAAFRRVSNRLLCQCGSCSYMVLSCNHLDCSSATYIRRTIKESLAQGKSEDMIVAGFVEQYGVKVLPEPPRQGFAFMAWIMPFLALALGAVAVGFALARLKGKRGAADLVNATDDDAGEQPAAMEATPELVEKYRNEIERELKNS